MILFFAGVARERMTSLNGQEARHAGRGFSVRAAAVLIAALFALSLFALGFTARQAYIDAERQGNERAAAASQVVATNAFWISELSRQALRRIDDALGPNLQTTRSTAAGDIREAVDGLPGIAKAYVVAADGHTLYSTDPQLKDIDVRDRDYFAALAKGAQSHVSSLLISRLNGQQIFVFSRRLERNGAFAGAAMISFDVALFEDIWRSLGLDLRSTVSLVRGDGMLMARYPYVDAPLDLSKYVLFTEYLKQAQSGTYPAISPADGVARFVGYRRVPETEMVALASVSAESVFAPFWSNVRTMAFLTLPAILLLAAASLWIVRLLRRDGHRQAALADALEANKLILRDIHHRVKNNLQSVQSLVRMQTIPAEVKADLQGRIAAMAAVHEHLYRLDQYTEVNAQSLLQAIAAPLPDSFGSHVKIALDVDPVEVERDQATPLALLVNELVTNALKYAFPEGRGGTIHISLKPLDETHCRLVVRDDGVGFDMQAVASGMGSRLVRAMTMQLGGIAAYGNEGGTVFSADIMVRQPQKPDAAGTTAAAAE